MKDTRRCDNCRASVRYSDSGDVLGCLRHGRITSPEDCCNEHKFKTGKRKKQ